MELITSTNIFAKSVLLMTIMELLYEDLTLLRVKMQGQVRMHNEKNTQLSFLKSVRTGR